MWCMLLTCDMADYSDDCCVFAPGADSYCRSSVLRGYANYAGTVAQHLQLHMLGNKEIDVIVFGKVFRHVFICFVYLF